MSTLTEYFQKNQPEITFDFGDRVSGRHNKRLYIGTTGGETTRDDRGALVPVFLDLPLPVDGEPKTVLLVSPTELKFLKEF